MKRTSILVFSLVAAVLAGLFAYNHHSFSWDRIIWAIALLAAALSYMARFFK